jgi:transposase
MSVAVKPAVEEAWAEAQSAAIKHVDGTTWLQAGVILALWTIATAGVTVFKILSNGQGDCPERELLTSSAAALS